MDDLIAHCSVVMAGPFNIFVKWTKTVTLEHDLYEIDHGSLE